MPTLAAPLARQESLSDKIQNTTKVTRTRGSVCFNGASHDRCTLASPRGEHEFERPGGGDLWCKESPVSVPELGNGTAEIGKNPVMLQDVTRAMPEVHLQAKFDEIAQGGFLPPMTGGAVFGIGWRKLKKQEAIDAVELYKNSRANGAARGWLQELPSKLTLSQQARNNWRHAKKGNPFSGMIDTKNNEIYLVPATSRSESRGVSGQVNWDSKNLKKQWFYKSKHLFEGNDTPSRNGKMRNIDHGSAAHYLEGIEKSPVHNQSAYERWIEHQHVLSNWLGFFVHEDRNTGDIVLNFKSGQLNAPNILLAANEVKFFENTETGDLDVSLLGGEQETKAEQIEKVTQLPDSTKTLVREAFSDLEKPTNRTARKILCLA